jgi:predicted HicB family RNase H-like nuclease
MSKQSSKPLQSEQLVVRVDSALRRRLNIAAEQDHRPVGNLVRLVLRNWLDDQSAHTAA